MSEFNFGTVATNDTEVAESPLLWLPGVDGKLSIFIAGTGTLASPTMTLYENGVDVSSTKLSGSLSIETGGRVIITKTFTNLVGGSVYKYYIYFTDGGFATVREGTLAVPKLGVKPSWYAPNAVDRLKVLQSPLIVYPSQSLQAQLTVDGEGVIEASSPAPTMYIYKGTTDDSSNSLSGSLSVSDRTITLKSIGSLSGGSEYIWYCYFTDNGKATVRYGEIICPKLGA